VEVIAEEVRTGPLCTSAILKLSQSLQVKFRVNNIGKSNFFYGTTKVPSYLEKSK